MSFFSIPSRTNGQKINYSWFESLKSAGYLIEQFLGGGFIIETSFSVVNNQATAANITGLVLDKTSYRSAVVTYEVRRATTTNEAVAVGKLSMIYRALAAAWDVVDSSDGDDHGLTFSITSAGQVQYISSSLGGASYAGTIKFKAITFSA